LPYILNVWEDERRGLSTVHLYRANALHVTVIGSVPEALDYLTQLGETEVWAFDRAGNLGLYSLDPADPEADVGPDFPLPRVDFEEAPEVSRRTPANLAPAALLVYDGTPDPNLAPRPLRKRPVLRLLKS